MQSNRPRFPLLRLHWLLVCMLCLASPISQAADFTELRQRMLAEIEADVRETASYIERESLSNQVMRAMGEVPRHEFVPQDMQSQAYENRPLPIGHGQTISQPYIVALMTELMRPKADFKVLEIGTGSAYQAAVLARLTRQVFSIEIIEELGTQAAQRIERLGIDNVTTRVGDGYYGWPEQAPFDAILVTAAADHIPPPLIQQLKPGGRMLIPVGGRFQVQQLVLVEKSPAGKLTTRQILPVRFVPLTRSD